MLSNNLSDKPKVPSHLEMSLLETAKFEGKQEGKHENAVTAAKNLKSLGLLTNEQIAKSVGLSLAEIENLSI